MSSFFEKLKGQAEEIPIGKKPKKKKVEKSKLGEAKEWFKPEGKLAVDVYQTDSDIVIQAPIAGVKKENLDILIENDMITIRGTREKSDVIEEKNYFYQECYWGPFSREIILPVEGDPSRAEASMKEGILTLKIPKIDRERKRKLAIKE